MRSIRDARNKLSFAVMGLIDANSAGNSRAVMRTARAFAEAASLMEGVWLRDSRKSLLDGAITRARRGERYAAQGDSTGALKQAREAIKLLDMLSRGG